MLTLRLTAEPAETIDADTLLLPVDGQRPALGGGAARAIRASLSALPSGERLEELRLVDDELAALRLSPHDAGIIVGVGRWEHLLVSAAYPHNAADRIHSPEACASMMRTALPRALTVAATGRPLHLDGRPTDQTVRIARVALTLIGTAYRVSLRRSVAALVGGLVEARDAGVGLDVVWSLPMEGALDAAREEARRAGLTRS